MSGTLNTLLCLLLLGLLAHISAQTLTNSGINIRVTQNGLNYATRKVVDEFYAGATSQQIDEFSGSSGSLSYRVSSVRIASLTRPDFTVTVNEGQGVTAALGISSIKVHGDFWARYKTWLLSISKSGSFDVSAGSISLTVPVSVVRTAQGTPSVTVRSCSGNIGSFNVDIHASGIVGWLLNLFEGTISRKIKDALNPKLCKLAQDLITEKVNPKLLTMPVTKSLQDGRLLLDYSLLTSPVFGANYIDTTIKADVSWKGRQAPSVTRTRSWPSVSGSTVKMASVYITDYVMNALGVLFHNDNVLTYNITRSELPSSARPWVSLNCQSSSICAGTFFSQLAQQYPNGWLEVGVKTSSPPKLLFRNNYVSGMFSGQMALYVTQTNRPLTYLTTTNVDLEVPVSLSISNNILMAQPGTPRLQISTVTGYNHTGLEELLILNTNGFINIELGKIGLRGIPLPTYAGVRFVNPTIAIISDTIVVSTDIDYTG